MVNHEEHEETRRMEFDPLSNRVIGCAIDVHLQRDATEERNQAIRSVNDLLLRLIFVLLSFNFLFFVRDFHAAIFVSPLMSTADAVSRAQANFRPLAVSV